jgi:hypothetical protein
VEVGPDPEAEAGDALTRVVTVARDDEGIAAADGDSVRGRELDARYGRLRAQAERGE